MPSAAALPAIERTYKLSWGTWELPLYCKITKLKCSLVLKVFTGWAISVSIPHMYLSLLVLTSLLLCTPSPPPTFLLVVSGLNAGALEEIMAQLEQNMMHDGSLVVCPY